MELPTPCVRATRAEAVAALAATFEKHGLERQAALDAATGSPFSGTVDHIVGRLLPYARLGVEELIFDKFIPYVLFVIFLAVLTAMEWLVVARHAPRQPCDKARDSARSIVRHSCCGFFRTGDPDAVWAGPVFFNA